jgi:flagellar biosynthesis protein FliP
LLKHVEKTFELGKEHALKNIESKPLNQITLPTLRGPVESWIPQNFCEEIYSAGFESIKANQINIEEIKYKLDSSVVQLFDKVKRNLTEPISNQLLKNQIQNLENLENSLDPPTNITKEPIKILQKMPLSTVLTAERIREDSTSCKGTVINQSMYL